MKLSYEEEKAWTLYCEETAGSLSARDFWWELPDSLQRVYLSKVRHARVEEVRANHAG